MNLRFFCLPADFPAAAFHQIVGLELGVGVGNVPEFVPSLYLRWAMMSSRSVPFTSVRFPGV